MNEIQATGEAFSSQKGHSAIQNIKFLPFILFLGHFWPPGSGPSFHAGSDQYQCGSIQIRIHITDKRFEIINAGQKQ
jgi:hypothetical protein